MIVETVGKNFKQGKAANWFSSVDKLHSFIYPPDAAKAVAQLGNASDTYGQIWHLPSLPAMTGKQWIEAVAKEMNVPPKYMALPKFMVTVVGLFVPVMREFPEMMYQYDRDYVFDSSKFEKLFGWKASDTKLAIKDILCQL